MAGMPRRYVDYPDAYAGWNYWSSIGSYIAAVGVLVFLFGVLHAFARRQQVENNPWGEGATTLEWTLSSPPPFHQFSELPKSIGSEGDLMSQTYKAELKINLDQASLLVQDRRLILSH